MSADQNAPAENTEVASNKHRPNEEPDPETFAYSLISHLLDEHGEGAAEPYLIRVVAEVMELEPGVRQRLSDLLLTEIKEEIARREDPRFSRATITLIESIEADWRNRCR